MRYTKHFRSFVLFFFVSVLSKSLISYSDGPPPARTGAPGELSCYNGYCHNSFPLNSGSATLSLGLDALEGGYVPEEVYQIKPSISDLGMARFGFQIQAVDRNTEAASGIFENIGENLLKFEEKEQVYITHALAKTANDSAEWTIDWKAPPAGSGAVDFYVAFVAANNNDNRSGDYVYTHKVSLEENLQTSIDNSEYSQFKAYPTVFDEELTIAFETASQRPVEVSIYNLSGQEVFYDSRSLSLNGFAYSKRISTADWESGMYIVRVVSEGHKWVRKVVKR